jgi:spermidine/putrescine transport system ATP-binding protein
MSASSVSAPAARQAPPDGAPEISLRQVTKAFGSVTAVDDLSLDIRAGEFFSLLGPSGCGKTTTLRMIGGFEEPTTGRIELRGRDVTRDPPDKRPVNMVFQNYALFPHLSVFENIAFGLRRRNVPEPEIRQRVADALALVHLPGYENRKPNQLSGGQQQRVALARALVNRPNVLLLDEPLGALDLKLRQRLQLELKRIQTEVGITFVYVTHDQEEALTMSDRIAVMSAGRVEQLGTPEELYDRPATRFVADFIGRTNLLRGTVRGVDSDRASIELTSGETTETAADGLRTGDAIELSVRPEVVQLGAQGSLDRALAGRVEQAAYLGANFSYVVRTKGGLELTVHAPKSDGRLVVGTDIAIQWRPEDALVLAGRLATERTGEIEAEEATS